MKKTWIRTAGVIVLAGLMTTGLDAQPGNRGVKGDRQGRGLGPCGQAYGPGRSGQAGDQFYTRGAGPGFALDLTEEQQEQMKALRLEHYKEMKPLKNQMAELKAREKTLMSEENVDMKAINSVIDGETELLNKIKKLQAGHRLAVRDILTEEQLMKLEQGMNFRGHRRGGWGSRPGTGQGNV
jgi:Spy/CpxP family protein refolding chaperone